VLRDHAGGRFRRMPRPKKPAAPDDAMAQVGLRLLCARKATTGEDIKPFANRLGCSESQWGNWENGVRMADPLAMARLWERFGVTLEWIFAGSLRGMDSPLQDKLEALAAKYGAVVGGTVARWPMQDEHRPVRTARVPPRRPSGRGTLHDPQDDMPN